MLHNFQFYFRLLSKGYIIFERLNFLGIVFVQINKSNKTPQRHLFITNSQFYGYTWIH